MTEGGHCGALRMTETDHFVILSEAKDPWPLRAESWFQLVRGVKDPSTPPFRLRSG